MARLFTALLPSNEAVEDLAVRVARASDSIDDPRLRWVPPDRWHVTLGFFGDDDSPQPRSRWLTRRASGLTAPKLRFAGNGAFGGVVWVGVSPASDEDAAALARLARASGADQRRFQAHLTVARWRKGGPNRSAQHELARLFDAYSGPWFTPAEVVLMESTPGPVYTALLRVPLTRA
ncbi:MAG TPA: 2'-5' RNA ligase family protein [Pseudonocardiaceae bacterium]